MLPAEYPRHRPVPSTLCPCRAWWGRFWRPLFRRGEAAIHKALIPADLVAVVELGEEGPPQRQQHPGLFPLAQPAPAGRGAAVSRRQFAPRGARPEDPQDALETPPRVGARPASLGSALLTRQMRSNPLPLRVGERSPGHALTLPAPPPQSQVLK